MNFWRQWRGPLAAGLLLVIAVGWLFQVRLGGGDLYPEYSSLRADALGTQALYEALAQIPGLRVERDYRPLARLGAKPRLVLLPGLWWRDWQSVPANQLQAIDAAAHNGGRVVLAFRADVKRDNLDAQGRPVEDDEEKVTDGKKKEPAAKDGKEAKDGKKGKAAKDDQAAKEGKGAKDAKDTKKKKARRPGEQEWEQKELAKVWGVTLKHRWLFPTKEGAQLETGAPAGLPARVAWQSDVHFDATPESGWRVLYRRAGEPVLIEKAMGQGSLVLLADAYCLSNEAMQKDRATALVSYLVGDQHEVTFVESTLGVLEENGMGFLARRYGLGGALALCALLGALYAWRRVVAFLPLQEDGPVSGEVALTYEPAAGFTALLRRSLDAAAVLPACVEEWRKGRRAGGNRTADARLEAAWETRDPKQPLAATYNALVKALKPR